LSSGFFILSDFFIFLDFDILVLVILPFDISTAVLLEAGAIHECEEHGWMRDRTDPHARQPVCVPKTLSELMTRWNRISWRNDRAALFRSGRPGLAIQVEVAA